jgi:hypothetical protein
MKLRQNVLQPLRIIAHDDPSAENPLAAIDNLSTTDSQGERAFRELKEFHASATPSGDHHFASRPYALLHEYSQRRSDSVLGNVFRVANRIHASVDSVVVLCNRDTALGARAISQACCQPYWNHLSRAERGSKPRLFFVDEKSDNDTLQGLLYMLGTHRPHPADSLQDAWALVVLDHHVVSREPPRPLNPLIDSLSHCIGDDPVRLAQRVIAVAPPDSPTVDRVRAAGATDIFAVSNEHPALQGLGPFGLLPAALLGINIMEILAGANWMSDQISHAASNRNPLLRFLQIQARYGMLSTAIDTRIRNLGLEAWRLWHQTIQRIIVPDFETTQQLEVDIVVDKPRFDPIPWNDSEQSLDRLHPQVDERNCEQRSRKFPVIEIHLSELDELHVGQLMQWMLLISVSIRLMGNDPASATGNHDDAI